MSEGSDYMNRLLRRLPPPEPDDHDQAPQTSTEQTAREWFDRTFRRMPARPEPDDAA